MNMKNETEALFPEVEAKQTAELLRRALNEERRYRTPGQWAILQAWMDRIYTNKSTGEAVPVSKYL